jgi:predicted NBD/HSP70 family sugar kinase
MPTASHCRKRWTALRAALEHHEDRLARALAHVVNLLDPDTIVLGSGLSNIARLYGNVASLLPRHVYSDPVTTPIVAAANGDASGVRSAAHLWG